MLVKIVQVLAFAAVVAAFIFSLKFNSAKTQNLSQAPEDFNKFILENTASSSIKNEFPIKSEQHFVPLSLPAAILPPATTTREINYIAAKASSIQEKNANLQSIVLVRCIFKTQYYDISSQPWNEERFNVGTGIVVSSEGLVLTTRHVLEVSEELLNDPAGREWKRIKCDIALTDKDQTPIASISPSEGADGKFKEAEIVFLPADEDYKNAKAFDFALLKIKPSEEFLYANVGLFPYLVNFSGQDSAVLVGYPGRESAAPQKLERFDGEFLALTSYEEALCANNGEPCGLRYVFKRYPYNFEKDFWKSTDLGIVTPYFRGGFSGAPAFFKGNLIGIVTHGASGSETKDGWDQAVILTSWDILEFLKKSNVIL